MTIDLDRNGTFGGGSDVESSGTFGSGRGTPSPGTAATRAAKSVPCGDELRYPGDLDPAGHAPRQLRHRQPSGIEIDRQTLTGDPLLGDPLAASYDDVDPYRATAVTNSTPAASPTGPAASTFHGWTGNTGHTDFTDTWTARAGRRNRHLRSPLPDREHAAGDGSGHGDGRGHRNRVRARARARRRPRARPSRRARRRRRSSRRSTRSMRTRTTNSPPWPRPPA